MSSPSFHYILPGSEASWLYSKTLQHQDFTAIESPQSISANKRALVIGLPNTHCRTLGLILPNTSTELQEAMVAAQLEKRGLIQGSVDRSRYHWHVLGHQLDQSYISVDLLSNNLPEELLVKHAATYISALRLYRLPQDEMILTQEQGQWVLSTSYQGKLWQSLIIGNSSNSLADLQRELLICQMSFEDTLKRPILGLTVLGSEWKSWIPALTQQSRIPVHHASYLETFQAISGNEKEALLPKSVFEFQRSRKRRKQILLTLLALCAVYALLFLAGWQYLESIETKQANLKTQLQKHAEPAQAVKATAQRWRALEPSTDVQRYPMVSLSQITTLMPPSGLLIKKYSTKLNEINIDGDARDAQTVTQFLEDLKKHPQLSRYTWSMPVPSVRNQVASFKIQGKSN